MTDHAELIARLQLVLDLLDAEASRLRAENEKMRKALASLEPVSWTHDLPCGACVAPAQRRGGPMRQRQAGRHERASRHHRGPSPLYRGRKG